jgi:hypothetical protein
MKALNGRYALRFNRRHGTTAHLFKNRFGAVLQETESQFYWLIRYVCRNPVESGLCARPSEWPWSSYRASVGLDVVPAFLDIDGVRSYFGVDSSAASSAIARLVADSAEVDWSSSGEPARSLA